MGPLSSAGISPGSLQQAFAHSLANTSKDLYPALPGATHSPPWLDHHLRELQEKAMAERPTYSAVEKRAVYSQKRVINTSFEKMGRNTLQVPSPNFAYSLPHTASTMSPGGTGVGSSSRDHSIKHQGWIS